MEGEVVRVGQRTEVNVLTFLTSPTTPCNLTSKTAVSTSCLFTIICELCKRQPPKKSQAVDTQHHLSSHGGK